MRGKSSETSGWPRTSWKSRSRIRIDGLKADLACYRRITITTSRARRHLGLRELHKPFHLRSSAIRVGRHPSHHGFPGPRIRVGPDVFLQLLSATSSLFVVPEIQISTSSDRFHARAATNHHRTTSFLPLRDQYCYRDLTITRTWAKLFSFRRSRGVCAVLGPTPWSVHRRETGRNIDASGLRWRAPRELA